MNEQVSRKSAAPFETFSTLFALKNLLRAVDCPAIVMKMMMNILPVAAGGEIYANALIEKEKDDLTEGDQGESRGDTMKKKMMNISSNKKKI